MIEQELVAGLCLSRCIYADQFLCEKMCLDHSEPEVSPRALALQVFVIKKGIRDGRPRDISHRDQMVGRDVLGPHAGKVCANARPRGQSFLNWSVFGGKLIIAYGTAPFFSAAE